MVYFSKWKIIFILAVCALGLGFSAPNFLGGKTAEGLPDWLPHKQVSLGLDLQGGSHLLLEVDVDVVISEQLESLVDSMRAELRKGRIRYGGLGVSGESAKVVVRKPEEVEKARNLLRAIDPESETVVDGNTIRISFTPRARADRRNAALQQSLEIIRRRIDETGVREPTIQRQGDDRILLQVPGVEDPERLKALIGKTAKMAFHLVHERDIDKDTSRTPPGARWLPSQELGPDGKPEKVLVRRRVMVSGEDLVDAQPSFDQRDNQPIVNFRFNARGGKKFGDVTSANVNRPFAIVLDDTVISAPVIREPILGGSGQISGNFSVQESNDLALLLRAGALPAPLTILEERTVGPGLGADSVAAGKIASIIGMILVVVFMAIAYGRFGLMADAALIINMFLILGGLSILQATLTLPGIAGIVLTIGMAVDANVLIFERIREEVRHGRTPINAIDAGYGRALTTIIDANVTTLIAAVLLYIFGSGPVRGFAVTLAIGIVTSMFTAIMLTRLFVVTWLRRTRPTALPI
ncbi:MAG: protein translocase subunit SecD [Rhodospirillaceae bacterium]|jgi:preprotein translocase subunit SecD|nr:protein translocase subunit SecD [Rhodospirillaceae bacterium]